MDSGEPASQQPGLRCLPVAPPRNGTSPDRPNWSGMGSGNEVGPNPKPLTTSGPDPLGDFPSHALLGTGAGCSGPIYAKADFGWLMDRIALPPVSAAASYAAGNTAAPDLDTEHLLRAAPPLSPPGTMVSARRAPLTGSPGGGSTGGGVAGRRATRPSLLAVKRADASRGPRGSCHRPRNTRHRACQPRVPPPADPGRRLPGNPGPLPADRRLTSERPTADWGDLPRLAGYP